MMSKDYDKNWEAIMKKAAAEAAMKIAEQIDDDLYRKYKRKVLMKKGKAICLEDYDFMKNPNVTIRFKKGHLYNYERFEYYSDGRIEYDVWNKRDDIFDIQPRAYSAEIPEKVFNKHFREFI